MIFFNYPAISVLFLPQLHSEEGFRIRDIQREKNWGKYSHEAPPSTWPELGSAAAEENLELISNSTVNSFLLQGLPVLVKPFLRSTQEICSPKSISFPLASSLSRSCLQVRPSIHHLEGSAFCSLCQLGVELRIKSSGTFKLRFICVFLLWSITQSHCCHIFLNWS